MTFCVCYMISLSLSLSLLCFAQSMVRQSCLLPLVADVLLTDAWLELERRAALVLAVVSLIECIAQVLIVVRTCLVAHVW
jgi:hypothetical protein